MGATVLATAALALLGLPTPALPLPLAEPAAPPAAPVARPPAERGPVTLVARLQRTAVARQAPRAGARGKLRLLGFAPWSRGTQGLLVTGRHRDPDGVGWVRVLLPMRPNGQMGWLRADRTRLHGTRRRVVVRLDTRRLELWTGQRRVATFPAGIGREDTPTPTGRFAVQDPLRTPAHLRGTYGDWVLILTGHSTALDQFNGGDALIGIHGAGAGGGRSWRVGQRASFGCVILSEPALAAVTRHVQAGTPVIVRRG